MRALQPAKVKEVHLDEETGTATVIVHDFQLSLAIGKEGQNARLAARLTGWRIDIKSETQLADEEAYANQDWAEGEWVENEAGEMVWQPAEGGEAVSAEQWSLGDGGDTTEAPAEGETAAAPAEGETAAADAGASAEPAAADAGASAEPPADATADAADAAGNAAEPGDVQLRGPAEVAAAEPAGATGEEATK
jgi:N utilization substance protein A